MTEFWVWFSKHTSNTGTYYIKQEGIYQTDSIQKDSIVNLNSSHWTKTEQPIGVETFKISDN